MFIKLQKVVCDISEWYIHEFTAAN